MRRVLLHKTVFLLVVYASAANTLVVNPTTVAAEEHRVAVDFPWGCPAPQIPMAHPAPYQVLAKGPRHVSEPVITLPPKSKYAYGWFGSNPAPAWGRHFGQTSNFTQWTRR